MANDVVCFSVSRGEPLAWFDFTTRRVGTKGSYAYEVSFADQTIGVVSKGSGHWGETYWVAHRDGEVVVGRSDQRSDVYRTLLRDHLIATGRLPAGTR